MSIKIQKTLLRIAIALSLAASVAICVGCNKRAATPTASKVKVPPIITDSTVTIDGLTWMRQNLNVETDSGSWCYGDDPANCEVYGRLYTWRAARNACKGLDGGWRLPTNSDWDNLIKYAGGRNAAGEKLKSKSGWNRCDGNGKLCIEDGNGNDNYGFSALPGGYRHSGINDIENIRVNTGIKLGGVRINPTLGGGSSGAVSFNRVGISGNWWSATEYGERKGGIEAYGRGLDYNYDSVSDEPNNKENGDSVRCVKDADA